MGPARRLEKETLIEQDLESDSDSDDGDGYKDFGDAFREEASKIAELNADRAEDGRRRHPFALAFSGGGIRAAAFQAGVLWRLAQADRLKDVEYFAAVSGGGYITAAFASHCVEACEEAGGRGPEPGQARDWYLKVVAKTLCRMQDNAGNFVRDCVRDPGGPTDGNGLLPRIFDLPILVGMVLVTLMVSPLMLVFGIAIVAFNVDMLFGELMRISFCSKDSTSWQRVFTDDREYRLLILSICALLLVQLVFYVVRIVVPGFKLTRKPGKEQLHDDAVEQEAGGEERERQGRPIAGNLYLFGHATGAMLSRVVSFLIVIAILPVAACLMEQIEYENGEGQQMRARQCAAYRADAMSTDSRDWEYLSSLRKTHDCGDPARHRHWVCDLEMYESQDLGRLPEEPPEQEPQAILARVGLAILAGMVALLIVLPIIGVQVFLKLLLIAGPFLFCFITVQFSQIAVFARVTKNSRGMLSWRQDEWDSLVGVAIWFFLLVIPFYEKIRASFHFYYKRTLRSNFFARGGDLPIARLLRYPYIPFILLTGTSTDFQPPGDEDTISELSFSPLHCGSEETGYVGMPQEMTLAKTAALSGAGCLDAFALAMNSDNSVMRIYLELLNLSWGDYIMFEPLAGRDAGQRRCRRYCREFTGALPWIVIFALQLAAYSIRDHRVAYETEIASVVLIVVTLALSFYNFVTVLDTFTLSSMVRLFHQTTSYFFVGDKPPPMLYVTDGGVRDCTTICQLLARRSERILLVLAAGDPEDELKVLRTAIDMARELKLAHFYDPGDATKSLDLTFEEYKKDVTKEGPLRLGISYCFAPGVPKHGHLIVVKNRLPTSRADERVRPLLTEEEIIAGPYDEPDSDDPDLEAFDGMKTAELGSLGCCDCCHTHRLNCGAKFPHGTGANYLYLTPQFCNGLMRLGHDISGEAVEAITSLPLPVPAPAVGR